MNKGVMLAEQCRLGNLHKRNKFLDNLVQDTVTMKLQEKGVYHNKPEE